jgi:serine/threonine-protein kinase HipA
LPEGPLRQLIARWAGVPVHRKFFLLHQLGEDLPDAVRIVADDTLEQSTEAAASRREDDSRLLAAGVELKFSALRAGRRMTIPVSAS